MRFDCRYHSGLLRSAGVSTRLGTSSDDWTLWLTKSFSALCCFGPSCWRISGSKSLMVFVSGSPDTINVLFWMEAYASGFEKWRTVLSSVKKLTSSTPSCWAPTFLTMPLITLSPVPLLLLTTFTFLLCEPLPPVLASPILFLRR